MLNLIAFLIVCLGCLNWLTIGVVQFDIIAGIFGSQSNIFSRIIYVLVGIAGIFLCVEAIKRKGRLDLKKKQTAKNTPNANDMLGNQNKNSET